MAEIERLPAEGTHARLAALVRALRPAEPLVAAVVHPCDPGSLQGAIAAAEAGLIRPILVGPPAKIHDQAKALGVDIGTFRLAEAPHSHAAAVVAVELVQRGEAACLVKGSLHSDELLQPMTAREGGLRTERRISHVFLMEVPRYPRLLAITDAAVNIEPSLEEKRDIVQNAIELMQAIGVAQPKVAILSAVETVTSKLPSTLDAAALCKMAERGQIQGGLLDGPLAFDNAINLEAARTKGIVSDVAGQADILLVPDLEAGNMLAKQLTFLSGAGAAGIVLGARVPIALTSRADSVEARVVSAALAVAAAEKRVGLRK